MAETVHFELPPGGRAETFSTAGGRATPVEGALDRQDGGQALTAAERREAEGLVELAEMLSLLKLNRPVALAIRSEEAERGRHPPPAW